jgi:predicted nuclease with TOPRIM domain
MDEKQIRAKLDELSREQTRLLLELAKVLKKENELAEELKDMDEDLGCSECYAQRP